jgi:predicted metal-dependent hydrolase
MMKKLLQFTLDLFEPVPPAPGPAPKAGKKPKFQQKSLVAQSGRAQPAIETIAGAAPAAAAVASAAPTSANELAPLSLHQALAPATFRHPLATREALLDEVAVAYQFRRSKRRTIGFSVGADGLAVSAPKWVPLHEVDKAVLEKSGWIVKKLQETRARHERLESARIDWKNGAILPFLGEQVQVVIDPRHAFAGVGAALGAAVVEAGQPGSAVRSLQVALPLNATPEQIRDAVQAWLMRQARQIFTERLIHFSPQLGVQWRKLSLSSAGTRWGSASADGSIRLNWRLVHFKLSVIDYVVVHELSHLRVMDHSPRFWDTVRAVVPDYADLRGQLKDDTIPRW